MTAAGHCTVLIVVAICRVTLVTAAGEAGVIEFIEGVTFGNLPIGEVTSGCDPGLPKPVTALPVLNASIDLWRQGFNLTWSSMVNASVLTRGNRTNVAAFQLLRNVTMNGSLEVKDGIECRTVVLNMTSYHSGQSNGHLVSYRYSWSNSNLSPRASYDVVLLALADQANGGWSDLTNFRSTLYVSEDWPWLVAVSRLPTCSGSNVDIRFTAASGFAQFAVGLCIPNGECPYLPVINAPQKSVVLDNVYADTYEVYVGVKDSPENCYCGKDETSGECTACGNSLLGFYYSVPGINTEIWQPNPQLISWCGIDMKICCLQVEFAPGSPSLLYTGYDISYLRTPSLPPLLNPANETALSAWTRSSRATICNVQPGAYTAKITPQGACTAWINTSLSNTVEIAELWHPSINSTVTMCDTEEILVSFSLLSTAAPVAAAYDIRLCDFDRFDSCPYIGSNINSGFGIFKNVTAGIYSVWLSLAGNCTCRQEDGSCVHCGNMASTTVTVPARASMGPWKPKATVSMNYDPEWNSTCVAVSFTPASEEYGVAAYNVTVVDALSLMFITAAKLVGTHNKSVLESYLCRIPVDGVTVKITPVGRCQSYSSTSVSTSLSASTRPPEALTTAATVGIVIGFVIIALLVVLLIVAHRRGWSFMNSKGERRSSCNSKQKSAFGKENSSQFNDLDSQHASLNMLFGGKSPDVLLLYANDHHLHVKIVASLAEMLETFGGCNVVMDWRCDAEAVQLNDWLHKQMLRANQVIVVGSEGAARLHEAYTSNQFYPKYAQKYGSSHHLSEALSLASKIPAFRDKLHFVIFPYSPDSCLSFLGSVADRPKYHLLEDMRTLVGALHGVASPCQWTCEQLYENSREVRLTGKLIDKMASKVIRRPSFFLDSFGPPEERFDSGIEHSPVLDRHSTFDRKTEVLTINSFGKPFDSSLLNCSAPSVPRYSAIERSNSAVMHAATAHSPLRTDMPDTEEIWETYVMPEPSIAGSLSSEQLRVALQRLNSERPDTLSSNIHSSEYSDNRSDISEASCVTVGGYASSSRPASSS